MGVPDVGKVWLPMEVLQTESGKALPYSRLEAPVVCDAARIGGWEIDGLVAFAERLARPAVTRIDSPSHLAREAKSELAAPLLFCGETLPEAFTEVATSLQGTTR